MNVLPQIVFANCAAGTPHSHLAHIEDFLAEYHSNKRNIMVIHLIPVLEERIQKIKVRFDRKYLKMGSPLQPRFVQNCEVENGKISQTSLNTPYIIHI